MSLTSITITETFVDAQGNPMSGSVAFLLRATMTDGSTGKTVVPTYISGVLDNTGSISVALDANDDSTTTPAGTSYAVTESLSGAPTRTYNVVVPHTAAGGTAKLSSLTKVP